MCASGCHHKELPLYLEDSLRSDLFCISAQEQLVHVRLVVEQFGSSLLLLPHCRCFSGRTYPDHKFPAVRDRHCRTQRQAGWNMQGHYWSLRLFPLMHMKRSTSSHIRPIMMSSSPGTRAAFPLPLLSRLTCRCQVLRTCHLSQLSLKHDKSGSFSQADWHGSLVQAGPSCQASLVWMDRCDHLVLQEAPCVAWWIGYWVSASQWQAMSPQEGHFEPSYSTGQMSPSFSTNVLPMRADSWDLRMTIIIINGSPPTDVIAGPVDQH